MSEIRDCFALLHFLVGTVESWSDREWLALFKLMIRTNNHVVFFFTLTRTSFSESPRHLLTMVLADILKNVVELSVATALASRVLPVPGGPNRSKPRQGVSTPWNNAGYLVGYTTASFSNRFGSSRPFTSLQWTSRVSRNISCRKKYQNWLGETRTLGISISSSYVTH